MEKKVSIVHYLITLFFAFGFGQLPPLGSMTPYGMGVLGTFIAAVYGWTLIGMIWPSLVALLGLGLYTSIPEMLGATFGNPVIAALIAMLPLVGLLDHLKVTDYMAAFFMTNKLSYGRPWLTIFIFFFGAYSTAFINPIISMIIFGAFVVRICKNLNIEPFTKLPTALMLGLAYSLMLGQNAIPFLGTGLTFNAAYAGMFGHPIPYVRYMLFMIPFGIVLILVFVLIMKYILRVDVSPLKEINADTFEERQVLSSDQKKAILFFLTFVVLMLLSSVLPSSSPIGAFLSEKLGIYGISTGTIIALMLVKNKEGEPLLNYRVIAKESMSWDVIFLTAYIMGISSFIMAPETGLGETIANALVPMTNLSPMVFIIAAMFFAAIVTNVANNVILAIIIMPVLMNFSSTLGLNGTGLVVLLFMSTQMALATPGASPITGIAYSQSSIVHTQDMMKMAFILIPLLFIATMLIGIPFMNLVF